MCGMVIVGAGQAGTRAAFALREHGWTGPITLLGTESTLPYERPPLSKNVLTADEEPGPPSICDATALLEAGVEFRAGTTVTDLDRSRHDVILADGTRIGYDRLLLATGAHPRRLPLTLTATVDSVSYLRTHADATALRARFRPGARVGIIGGGFLGLELAASATARGCTVTVVEMAPQLMGRVVPADAAAVVAARHRQAYVDIRCHTGVSDLAREDHTVRLTLTDGDPIHCDTVVAAVGAIPDTALAEKAGLAVENGVRADSRLSTSDSDVFAAGDCCSFPHPLYDDRRIRLEAWHNAQDQGPVAARNMLGADEPYTAVPSFWTDQYDLTLHIAGLPDTASTEIVRRRADGTDIRFGTAPDGRLLCATAVAPGNAVAKDIRLAELLIARRATPDPARLADPTVNLKTLLRH